MKNTGLKFETRALHGNDSAREDHNAIRFPVYSGVAFGFDNAEDMELAFTHRKPAHVYSRITNPTVENFEQKLSLLEGGFGAIALASGMAAITTSLLALLRQGDNLIVSKYLFGNTYSLLRKTIAPLGIEARFVDICNEQEIRAAIDTNTRLILLETITNPQMIVPDFAMIAAIAKSHRLILAADSTVTPPCIFAAKNFGINLVLHSTTKYISGGATSVGGAIVDLGSYDWQQCPALADYHKFGQAAFVARLRMEVHRNFGSCMAPQSAYLQTLGLETLSLRVKRSCASSLEIARYLESRAEVKKVHYPGLSSSPYHEIAKAHFKDTYGGVLSFELADKQAAFRCINRLQLIKRATNINDNKSLIIHPASTIFSDCTTEEKAEMGVSDSLIRLSVGIEDPGDLLNDIDQALTN